MESEQYSCFEATEDILEFFKVPFEEIRSVEYLLNRALDHMVLSTAAGGHQIKCQQCWDFYMDMKKIYCVG